MDGRPVNDDINTPFAEATLRPISSSPSMRPTCRASPHPSIPLTPSVAHRPPSTTHYTTITIPVTIVAQSPHPSHRALVTKVSDTLFTEGNKKKTEKKKERRAPRKPACLSRGVRAHISRRAPISSHGGAWAPNQQRQSWPAARVQKHRPLIVQDGFWKGWQV